MLIAESIGAGWARIMRTVSEPYLLQNPHRVFLSTADRGFTPAAEEAAPEAPEGEEKD